MHRWSTSLSAWPHKQQCLLISQCTRHLQEVAAKEKATVPAVMLFLFSHSHGMVLSHA